MTFPPSPLRYPFIRKGFNSQPLANIEADGQLRSGSYFQYIQLMVIIAQNSLNMTNSQIFPLFPDNSFSAFCGKGGCGIL